MRINSLEARLRRHIVEPRLGRPRKGRICLNKADAKRWTQLEGLRALRTSPDAENVGRTLNN